MDDSRDKINLKAGRGLRNEDAKKNRDPSPEQRAQDRIPLGGNPRYQFLGLETKLKSSHHRERSSRARPMRLPGDQVFVIGHVSYVRKHSKLFAVLIAHAAINNYP